MVNTIKSGKVVIVGRPNTGKSTLLNTIMQQKISITSPLPQTTRTALKANYKDERGEIYFVDTPGIFAKVNDLVSKKVNTVPEREALNGNVIMAVVDISRQKNEEENKMLALVRKFDGKKVLVMNKIDKAVGSKDHLAEYEYMSDEFDKVVKVSALLGTHVKGLLEELFEVLPEKTQEKSEFDEEYRPTGNLNSNEFIAEIIREKAFLALRDEIPYSVNCEVEEVIDKKRIIVVKAKLLTNEDRYKKIIIGKGGKKIKEIGHNVRKELEIASGRKVFLELTVETDRHWMERVVY